MILDKLKIFDVYKRYPKDVCESTLSGAIISISASIIMILLFLSETSRFLNYNVKTEMNIDNSQTGQKINVNIDIIFHRLPCDILSLDIMDVMGKHKVHVGNTLFRRRIAGNGEVLEDHIQLSKHNHTNKYDHASDVNYDSVKHKLEFQEGCQIYGTFLINKVPGNFHISAHAFGDILRRLFESSDLNTLDLSHTINHLSFGHSDHVKEIRKKFSHGVINPLDGHDVKSINQFANIGIFYEYYIKVVPSVYIDYKSKQLTAHQFSASTNSYQTMMLPSVFFRYDLAPVQVKFIQERERLYHFIVQLCAILGGIYTVAGIIDAILHKSVIVLIKKAQIGKLS